MSQVFISVFPKCPRFYRLNGDAPLLDMQDGPRRAGLAQTRGFVPGYTSPRRRDEVMRRAHPHRANRCSIVVHRTTSRFARGSRPGRPAVS
jgi:hypothetical protein